MHQPIKRSLQVLASALLYSSTAMAASALTAQESDPVRLGWMTGAPPSPEKRIMQPQSNFFTFPKLRWTVCHIRELMPTQQVSRGLAGSEPLEYRLDAEIDNLMFTPLGADKPISWKQSLNANYTDGLLVLHKGKVVYEYYSGCLNEKKKHAAMSMTKSLMGLLAEIMIADGTLDDTAFVESILPELKGSGFEGASVRQVLDMTTGLQFSENYTDPNADIWVYSKAASPLPKSKDYRGPEGYFEYLATVSPQGQHGERFGYKTINSDVLGWILSRISGKEVTELLSEQIWEKIGAEQDAYMTVDAIGTPFAGGGLSAGLRDMARIGQLMLQEGQFGGQQVFPAEVVASIRAGADTSAFARAGYDTLPGGSYKSMWWVLHNKLDAYAARGVYGQTLYIAPKADMVIARFASFPTAANRQIDPTSLPAYEALGEYLMQR